MESDITKILFMKSNLWKNEIEIPLNLAHAEYVQLCQT